MKKDEKEKNASIFDSYFFFFNRYFSYNRNKEKKGKGRNGRMDRIFVRRIFEIISRANVCAHIRMVGKIAYNGHEVGCREKRKE